MEKHQKNKQTPKQEQTQINILKSLYQAYKTQNDQYQNTQDMLNKKNIAIHLFQAKKHFIEELQKNLNILDEQQQQYIQQELDALKPKQGDLVQKQNEDNYEIHSNNIIQRFNQLYK